MNILEACADPKLFAPFFKSPATWASWRAFLAALFALPMTDEEAAIFRKHTRREALPDQPSTEAYLVVGRRGGKSFIMALIAVFLACFREYRQFLQPGERATVAVIAADRKQARVVMRYVRGMLNNILMLRRMIERETAEGFDLNNAVTIEVTSASFRASRGYTFAAVIADEIAFWRTDDDSANADTEILNAVRPGLSTVTGAMLICASSPHAKRGELWENFHRCFGKANGPLVWQATTREMNPSVRQSVIDEALERDHARASAEYLAIFRSDIETFISREAVESVVIEGRYELAPVPHQLYRAFVDPSGGSSDSFTLAIAHRQKDGTAVLDATRERKPPFAPSLVIAEFAALLKTYRISEVHGDRYAGEFPREIFRSHGIKYVVAEKPKSDIYRDTLPLLNSGKVELLADARLTSQLCSLERRVARSGKDSIDHAPGAHDDLANAVCGALALASAANGPLVIPPTVLERMRQPGPFTSKSKMKVFV